MFLSKSFLCLVAAVSLVAVSAAPFSETRSITARGVDSELRGRAEHIFDKLVTRYISGKILEERNLHDIYREVLRRASSMDNEILAIRTTETPEETISRLKRLYINAHQEYEKATNAEAKMEFARKVNDLANKVNNAIDSLPKDKQPSHAHVHTVSIM